jgi:hypothetical protein
MEIIKNFDYWDKLYRNEHLEEFNSNRIGLLWLKIKSILRIDLLEGFLEFSGYEINTRKKNDNFCALFDLLSTDVNNAHLLLDNYIKKVDKAQTMNVDIQQLTSELYKLHYFEWCEDYRNSLDKYLMSKYVRIPNPSFDHLISKFETEINPVVQDYVLNNWYNYWCNILIESIFKSHPAVLPTIGYIKGVEFFINDIPFDLKVTYLPVEYIKQKRKEKSYMGELAFLKQKAKKIGIDYDKKAKSNDILYEITEKMKDRNDDSCRQSLQNLKNERIKILRETQENPQILAKWLYENQGEMHFGAENRLFLILVDTDDFNHSWKLKRNIDLLRPAIISYLDSFASKRIEDLQVTFELKDKPHEFSALADVILVMK